MERITVNIVGKTRKESLYGREHLVAPVTLIVPGVLNGSLGPLYYPPEEIEKSVDAWNRVPMLVHHPTLNNKPVSARRPDVLSKQFIGEVFNAKADGKLTGEAWFDVEKTNRTDPSIIASLKRGENIEVSTGLLTTNEPAPEGSTFAGKPYTHIARNYRPDHLAVLPDQVGACSVDDGCGILANASELSHDDLRSLLQTKLVEKLGTTTTDDDFWVVEVFDDHVIYRREDKLFQLGYAKNDKELILSEEQPVEVKRVTTFEPVNNGKGGSTMNRKEAIDKLVANDCCWEETDRETLNGLSDEQFVSVQSQAKKQSEQMLVANAAAKGYTDPGGNEHTWNAETKEWDSKLKTLEPGKKDESVENKKKDEPPKPQTTEEYLAAAPPDVRSAVQNAMAIEKRERKNLIAQLTSDVEGIAKESLVMQLTTNSLSELRGLMALAPKPAEPIPTANYAGATGGSTQAGKVDRSDYLPLTPTLNFEKKKAS